MTDECPCWACQDPPQYPSNAQLRRQFEDLVGCVPDTAPPHTEIMDAMVAAGLEWAQDNRHRLGELLREKVMRQLVEHILGAGA